MNQTEQHNLDLRDSDYITFADAPHEEEFLAAIDKITQAIAAQCRGEARDGPCVDQFAAEIEALQIGEVLAEMDAAQNAPRLLFLIVEKLAAADVDTAWRGLASLPSQLALAQAMDSGTRGQIAYPLRTDEAAGTQTWLAFAPHHTQADALWCWEPSDSILVRCAGGGEALQPGTQGLLGFKDAQVLEITRQMLVQTSGAENATHTAHATTHTTVLATKLRAYAFALFGGLLAGALQRLMSEAYAYAKVRQSFGKPIAKHQAVALRLADIALNHQAARLYLLAELTATDWQDTAHNSASARHLGELAHKVARDAVQIAAAHGYVEGLPFRQLFEKVRSLSTLLGYAMGNAATND